MFHFMLSVAFLTTVMGRDVFETATHEMAAKCRAQCLSQFYVAGSRSNCFDSAECWMCWDSCSLIYMKFNVWSPLCSDKHLCLPGCQEACNFRHSHLARTQVMENLPEVAFMYPPKYSYQPADDTINFEWSTPEISDGQEDPLVYVLLMRDQLSSNWKQLEQTFYTNLTFERGLLKASTQIRLTAYNSYGQVSQTEKLYTGVDLDANSVHTGDMFRDEEYLTSTVRQHHRNSISLDFTDHHSQWEPVIQALRYSTKHQGGIDAVVSWARISHDSDLRYELCWRRAEQATDITGQLSTYNNVAVITLWPNCIYQLTVRAYTFGSQRPIAESRTIIMDTAKHTSGSWPLTDSCPGCIPPQYVIVLAVPILIIIIILLSMVVMKKGATQSNVLPKTSTPIQPTKKQFPSNRHASVKQQLSSLSARISQGPRSPTRKHDRLVEEDTSFAFEQKSTKVSCNV